MAKNKTENKNKTEELTFDEPSMIEASSDAMLPDFNVDEEYKATPLIPNITTQGTIQDIILWNNVLTIFFVIEDESAATMNDGETPINGATVKKKIFLPKEEDKSEMTKNGRQSKYQFKINQLKRFCDQSNLDLRSPTAIMEAVNGSLTGETLQIQIVTSQYRGEFFNEVEQVSSLNT